MVSLHTSGLDCHAGFLASFPEAIPREGVQCGVGMLGASHDTIAIRLQEHEYLARALPWPERQPRLAFQPHCEFVFS